MAASLGDVDADVADELEVVEQAEVVAQVTLAQLPGRRRGLGAGPVDLRQELMAPGDGDLDLQHGAGAEPALAWLGLVRTARRRGRSDPPLAQSARPARGA
ncbi:MAG: hypothetical protein JW751_02505 [Polyangiaceae bacterium]|nr:hypothetical protein [Polyangiaceae bacterium]